MLPRRSSSRLKSLLPVDYRIPGDNRLHSPGRSRSRSRPRVDTPHHSLNQSSRPSVDDIVEEDRDGLDFSEPTYGEPSVDADADEEDDGFIIRRSSSRPVDSSTTQSALKSSVKRRGRPAKSSVQLDESVMTTDAGGSTAEENEFADESNDYSTTQRRSRRSRTSRTSPSPLRDVLQSVSNAAGSVAHSINQSINQALASVSEDRQPEDMNGDDTEEHNYSSNQLQSVSRDQSISRDESDSPFSIEVSPPEPQAAIYSNDQPINHSTPQTIDESTHLTKDTDNSRPGWLIPFILLLTALLAAAGYHYLPSVIESANHSINQSGEHLSLPGLSSDQLDSIGQSINQFIAKSKMMSKSEFAEIYDSVRTDLDSIEKSLVDKYQSFQSELSDHSIKHEQHEQSINQIKQEFDRKFASATEKVTEQVANQLTDRISNLLGDSVEAQNEATKALKSDIERWTNHELATLRTEYSRLLTEKLAQTKQSNDQTNVAEVEVKLDESEIHRLIESVQDTLKNQIDSQIQLVDKRIEKSLESFVSHAELSELARELRASIASRSDESSSQESNVHAHDLQALEARVIRLVDEKLLDAVKSQSGSQSIDQADIQKLINDALRTVRSEIEERIDAIKPQSINQEELTHSITDAVKRDLTSTFDTVIRQSVAQAVSEQALNQNKDTIADAVAQLATLSQRATRSEEELVTLKNSVNNAIESMLSKVESSSTQPDQAALQKMTVLESTVQALEAAIKALQSDKSGGSVTSLTGDNVQALVFNAISTHASDIYKSLTPLVAADIDAALEKFSADRTDLVDYALATSGGQVIASSPSFELPVADRNPVLDFLTRMYVPHKGADEVIHSDMEVGSCWPMKGSKGGVLLHLRQPISVNAFTLQHVSPAVSPDTTSMPRDLKLCGVPDGSADQVKSALKAGHSIHPSLVVPLGTFSYDRNGRQVQQWSTTNESKLFSRVLVEVGSNYGNPNYTCIYRVRVHGKPAQ